MARLSQIVEQYDFARVTPILLTPRRLVSTPHEALGQYQPMSSFGQGLSNPSQGPVIKPMSKNEGVQRQFEVFSMNCLT